MVTIYNSFSSASDLGNLKNDNSYICTLNAGTAFIKNKNGNLIGLTINSSSSGIADIYDGTSFVGNLMHSSMVLTAGTSHNLNGEIFVTGLFVNISGTANITLRYK